MEIQSPVKVGARSVRSIALKMAHSPELSNCEVEPIASLLTAGVFTSMTKFDETGIYGKIVTDADDDLVVNWAGVAVTDHDSVDSYGFKVTEISIDNDGYYLYVEPAGGKKELAEKILGERRGDFEIMTTFVHGGELRGIAFFIVCPGVLRTDLHPDLSHQET